MSKNEKERRTRKKIFPSRRRPVRKKRRSSRKLKLRPGIRRQRRRKPKATRWRSFKRSWAGRSDLLLRTAAEYENFRKRTEKEKRAIYADATAEAVKAILPIADSLEYAVKAEDGATAEYQKGLELIQSQFNAALEKLGVSPVGEAGEEFNPELHNAVAHVEDESIAENTIVEVFQKGYMLKEKVIRHAMVKVAN